jgi:hypothetical protein
LLLLLAEGDVPGARASLADAESLAARLGGGPCSSLGRDIAALREALGGHVSD